MKKLFALVALVLGVVSCQTDPNDLDVVVGGQQDVMLTVSLPEATRANSANGFQIADLGSTYDLRYILEVYRVDNEGNILYDNCQRQVKRADAATMSFPVRLAPGYKYQIVAWADIVDNGSDDDRIYKTTDGLDAIEILSWDAMDETRDAYTGTKYIADFSSASDLSMALTRPFAKVRVVATDIDDITDLGLSPKAAKVSYLQDMYTMYNAVTAEASAAEAKSHSYTYTSFPYTDATGEMTLFADYVFVPESGTAKFSLNVYDDEAATRLIKENSFSTDIFVERNKITTIKGDVLTEGGNVSVKVENDLGEKVTINMVDTADDLQEIINNTEDGESANITLGGDIDLNDLLGAGILSTRAAEPAYGLIIPAGKSVVLDLKGFTISQSKTQTAAYSMIENLGTLTIKDDSANKTGKISYADNGQGGEYVSNTIHNSGLLTIEGGIVENNSSATVASNGYPHPIDNSGTLVINDGTFSNNANYSSMRIWCTTDDDTIVTINGGTFNGSIDFQTPSASANKGTLTINGGTFNADTYTKCAVRLLGFGADVDEMNGYILGGHFNGAIALKKYINGEFNSKVFDITAGTFTTEAKEGTNIALVNDDYAWVEIETDLWTVEHKADVAKIGEVGYTSLAKAVADVKDGETITLVANEVFTENNYYDNGGYKDGLGYAGDKSFTLDLGGNTISQDGYLNDYLLWFKNVGSKDNTITIKNGTLDAGTTAYCALCTASSNENQLTIDLENVKLINNKSNGSVLKVRGGSVVNVNADTQITGKDSYLGIENWNATVNVFEGAEIYMNGTTSYNGCLIGVGGNGVINVYGGYGKGVSGGLIAMTSGGTINVSGGEWIANTDGTYANSNKSVLVAQSDKQYNAGAGNAVVNVTGGTFKGGYNCYGNAVGDAQINITGGNFNSNPANYVVAGYGVEEDNGVWTVVKAYDITEEGYTILNAPGMFWFANEVNSGANYFEGKTIKLGADIDLNNAEWTPIGSAYKDHGFMGNFDGNGKIIKNLKITALTPDSDQYVYGGLFGVTEGVDKDNQNYIKNLTIENVNIDLDGHIVAAAVAYPYYTALENIKVKGNVSIKGEWYTSGVLAYTRRCVDAKNISIEANAGSVIEGTQTVGGVISDIQMNGGLTANYSNFKAENLTIKGTQSVGGISGIIGAQNLDGAIVKNVTIVSDDTRKGTISGSFDGVCTIKDAVVENVTGADDYIGCLYSGTASDRSSVTINGDVYTYDNGWIVNGCKIIADGVILNETGEYIISNAAGMFWFANEVNVNGNGFSGKTVKLANDIDLENAAWTPVGQTGATTFNGVFDGQNYTIYNLNVNSEAQTGAHYSSGLFGWVESHTAGHGHLKNIKINGATINGHHNCGALVGYITQETALVENCHVTGATVTCTKANDDADGDKTGALIGNATVATPVKDCTAANSTVSAGRDAGQVIGAGKEANATGCSATNVTVSANGTGTGANVRNEVIGRLL